MDVPLTTVLSVEASRVEGYRVLLGTKTVTLDNDHASAPFGSIDTPGQGGTASGIAVNFGWALTPGTPMLPIDGSRMQVVVDGVAIGTVNYNYCRGTGGSSPAAGQCDDDVAQLFPGATNITHASGAQGYFVLDTTILANGRHTIAWGVSDDAGRLAGIGSRFFTVLNDGSSSVVASARTAAALSDAPARVMGAAAALAWRSTVAEGVSARTGFDFGAPFEDIVPDDAGVRHVTIPELGRLELHFGSSLERGYLQANGTLRALPPGSRLDAANGVFTWAPGPAYVGLYELVFLQGSAQIRVQVTLETNKSPGALMRGHIDLPATGRAVSGHFTVAGWALDERAWQGSGVDAVHVWALRRDVPASAAVFLGAAELAGLRPDVAAVFGPRFNRTGWGLSASGLAPGTYDVTAFFWSRRAASFADARTVSVTVR